MSHKKINPIKYYVQPVEAFKLPLMTPEQLKLFDAAVRREFDKRNVEADYKKYVEDCPDFIPVPGPVFHPSAEGIDAIAEAVEKWFAMRRAEEEFQRFVADR